MKTCTLTASLVACLLSLSLLADDKPISPPSDSSAKAIKHDSVRIAELEARVAQLEKIVESLRKAAAIPQSGKSGGPTSEDRQGYESLSEAGKEKLRSFFRENLEELRNAANDEQRRALIRGAFEKIEAEDKAKKANY